MICDNLAVDFAFPEGSPMTENEMKAFCSKCMLDLHDNI